MKAILFTALLSACTPTLKHVNRVGMAVAAASLACDYGQTRWHAARGWNGFREANPMLGPTPSTLTVTGWFLSTAIVGGLFSLTLPERIRPILYSGITGRQLVSVVRNAEYTPVCGVDL